MSCGDGAALPPMQLQRARVEYRAPRNARLEREPRQLHHNDRALWHIRATPPQLRLADLRRRGYLLPLVDNFWAPLWEPLPP